jgi:S-adenosylhomocysteine hydrolase
LGHVFEQSVGIWLDEGAERKAMLVINDKQLFEDFQRIVEAIKTGVHPTMQADPRIK